MNNKWKSRLLSSGLPLEYQTAKMLVKKKFDVAFEYPYFRKNKQRTTTEFSIDLYAIKFANETEIIMPIECKYRAENKKWLFLPDVNQNLEIDYYDTGLAVRCFPQLSAYKFDQKNICKLENKMPVCVKGIEIDLNTGNTYEKDIKHGIAQLKYALPSIMSSTLFDLNTPSYTFPQAVSLICPVLLTNSEMRVLKDDIKIDSLKMATSIDEVSNKANCIIYRSSLGPDFSSHLKGYFVNLKETIDGYCNNANKYFKIEKPFFFFFIVLVRDMERINDQFLYFSYYIICNENYFPTLIDEINYAYKKDLKNAKRII